MQKWLPVGGVCGQKVLSQSVLAHWNHALLLQRGKKRTIYNDIIAEGLSMRYQYRIVQHCRIAYVISMWVTHAQQFMVAWEAWGGVAKLISSTSGAPMPKEYNGRAQRTSESLCKGAWKVGKVSRLWRKRRQWGNATGKVRNMSSLAETRQGRFDGLREHVRQLEIAGAMGGILLCSLCISSIIMRII